MREAVLLKQARVLKVGGWTSEDPVADAFSHWTWHKTHSALVCDLQGVRGDEEEPRYGGNRETYYYLLTDPAINSTAKEFGVSDMGYAGIQAFFFKHKWKKRGKR